MKNHPIIDLWPKILNYAKSYSLSDTKKASIIREYLQNKILGKIYQQKSANEIFFVGGTSLRILYGLDRFSEDLDFDVGKINKKNIEKIFDTVVTSFQKENFPVEGYKNIKKDRQYYELRFPYILKILDLSQDPKQKLVIKLDFVNFWKEFNRQVVLVEKYGYIYRVNTISKDQILSEKIHAYCHRNQTLARDLYDIIWLLNHGAKTDWQFFNKNSINKDIIKKLKKRFAEDERKILTHKKAVQPLVINEEDAKRIYFFSYYFPKESEIEYQGVNKYPYYGRDAYELRYRFLVKKEKEIFFKVIITGTAAVKLTENFKKKLAEKISSFYRFNPTISYQTKMINSYIFDDFAMAQDEEISDYLE